MAVNAPFPSIGDDPWGGTIITWANQVRQNVNELDQVVNEGRLSPTQLSATIGSEIGTEGTPARTALDTAIGSEIGTEGTPARTALNTAVATLVSKPGPVKDQLSATIEGAIDEALPVTPSSSQTFGRLQSAIISTAGTRVVIGVDQVNASGAIYLSDTTNGVLIQSDDVGATTGVNKTFPTGVTALSASRIVRSPINGKVYLLGRDTTDNLVKVWSATANAQNDVFTWSAPLLTLTTGATGFVGSIDASNWASGNVIVVTEYGDPVGGPSVYVSTDGTTFERTYGPDSSMRHTHHIACDPFEPGHIWLTCGDGIAKTIQRSTDYGKTWSVVVASSQWQGVQVSFSKTHVWVAGDSRRGTAFVIDRSTLTPRWAASNYHHDIPPATAIGARAVEATTTASSTLLTSAGKFTSADQRRYVQSYYVHPGTYIAAVNPPNEATLSQAAFASGTATTMISGDLYFANAYYGAVDPETGVYYCVANDTSNAGRLQGMFWLPRLGGRFEVLDPGGDDLQMNQFVFVYRGKVFTGKWMRPLVTF